MATDEQRLNLLRDVFGTTANLTAMRPILVVEGQWREMLARRATDARIYPFLSDAFGRISILPSGGKGQCITLVQTLNTILKEFSTSVRAHALLDRDLQKSESDDPYVHLLPVSMVENLLVDATVLWDATTLVHHKMMLRAKSQVEEAIEEILDDLDDAEIDRRIKATIGAKTFRVTDPVSTIAQQLNEFVSKVSGEFSDSELKRIENDCREKVSEIRAQGKRREFFHGKSIIDEFYRRHMQATGMSKEIFVYECARKASARPKVKLFVDDLLCKIGVQGATAGDPP